MVETLINISNLIVPIFYKVIYMSIVGSILGILILIIIKFLDTKLSAKWKCFMLLIPVIFLMIPISRIQVNINSDFVLTSMIDKVEAKLNNAHTLNYDTLYGEEIITKIANVEEVIKEVFKIKDKIDIEKRKIDKIDNINDISKMESTNNINRISNINIRNIVIYILIPVIWLVGLGISIITLVVGNINLEHKISKSKKLKDSEIRLILTRCKRKLRITKKIEIRIQDINVSPCIYGIIRPKILVSEEFIRKKFRHNRKCIST